MTNNISDKHTFYHGWYSLKQAKNKCSNNFLKKDKKKPASIYYLDENNNKIEVTMVSKTLEHGCNTQYLDDIVYRGLVYNYVGICHMTL